MVESEGPYCSIEALWRASGVKVATLRKLAAADAFQSMGLDRQAALWQVRALRDDPLPMFDNLEHPTARRSVSLPPVPAPRKVLYDYASLGLSLKNHPISFLRERLDQQRITPNRELKDAQRWPNGRSIAVAGMTLVRQRPATASGVVFITIEDETGIANLIVRPKVYERFRKAAKHGVIIIARGKVERQGEVVHVMVQRLEDIGHELRELVTRSRDFH